jgi:hypothetical protein
VPEFVTAELESDGLASFNIELLPGYSIGFHVVTITSLPDIPGCNIEAFEPVSIIKVLITPPVFTDTEVVPHSKRMGIVGVATALLGA